MVKIFYCQIPDEVNEAVIPFLSEYRQNKLLSIRCEKMKKQGICAELLLEKAVGDYYSRPLPIIVNEHGKPYFENEKIFFSISHSGNWAACAVADRELGLDIQIIKECNAKLIERHFTEDEKKYIRNSENPDISFTEVWCKKESRLKAVGTGLKGGINSFSVLSSECEYAHGVLKDLCYCVCVPGCDTIEAELINIKLL